jgi:hypothetical protein
MDIGPIPPPPETLALLFCVFWPFVAMALLWRRVRWRVFLAATLAPLAVSVGVALIQLRRALAVVTSDAARDAVVANALGTIVPGIWSAAAVAVIALILQRRRARRLQT